MNLRAALAKYEEFLLRRAVFAAGGNQAAAARRLEVSPAWLCRRLARYNARPTLTELEAARARVFR